jgi:hypothetical protein
MPPAHRLHPTIFALALWTVLGRAEAAPAYRIEALYSTLDGSYQYVQLRDVRGPGQENPKGLALIATNRYGVVKTIPVTYLPAAPSRGVLLATVAMGRWWESINMDDYYSPVLGNVFPERFLATDGGTVELTDGDRWDYDSLPVDGTNALTRDYGVVSGSAFDALGHSFGPRTSPAWVSVVEYHNATYGRYFVTASAPDIDALDSGRIAGWKRTGQSLSAFDGGRGSALVPVCRYYYPTGDIGSHFFSASEEECTAVAAQVAGAVLETAAAFYIVLPDRVTGACPDRFTIGIGTYGSVEPIYRVWDATGGFEHRYTSDRALRDRWVAEGWTAEGYGPDAVVMCGI